MEITIECLKSILDYCPKTGTFTWKYRDNQKGPWNVRHANKKAGSLSKSGYVLIHIDLLNRPMRAHRIAWFMTYGVWPKQIDHINHKRDDNRLINLRECTNKENGKNSSLKKSNKSGHCGVFYIAPINKWLSNIMVDGKTKYLGVHQSLEKAIEARKQGEVKYGFHANHGK